MTDREHLLENIICHVEHKGWSKIDDEEVERMYPFFHKNGLEEVDRETFEWLVDMAVQCAYYNDVWLD